MISDSTNCAVLLATAKQIPCAPLMMAVLMPITSAFDDTSGPPELPGLSAASVWITSSIVRPLTERIERPIGQVAHAVGAEQRQIGVGIDAEHPGLTDVTLDVPQPDLLGGTDHVAV